MYGMSGLHGYKAGSLDKSDFMIYHQHFATRRHTRAFPVLRGKFGSTLLLHNTQPGPMEEQIYYDTYSEMGNLSILKRFLKYLLCM